MMVLYFSGTGNSRYIAAQIAQALCVPTLDLNVRIQAADTSPVQTGPDIVLVTPHLRLAHPPDRRAMAGGHAAAPGTAHLVCDGLRQRDRQRRPL